MIGQSTRERQVFLRRRGAKDRLGELTIAFVSPGGELSVEAAAAGLGMAQRGHAYVSQDRHLARKSAGYRQVYPEVPIGAMDRGLRVGD
jgi:hypothetical protein